MTKKKFQRFLALVAVSAGMAMIGYSLSEGFRRGFDLDLDGNWDPVLIGIGGVAVLGAGAIAYAYFAHPDAGIRRRRAFRGALRRSAAWSLAACECAGVVACVNGFVIFLSEAKAGRNPLWALGLGFGGIAAAWTSSSLMPRVRGGADRRRPRETSVPTHDDL
ncbi:MAG: hypothetical protein RL272_206 [Candidatus Parcubacteria bacterium]|jgi:hypothetical protein